jgi:hypothetical protein
MAWFSVTGSCAVGATYRAVVQSLRSLEQARDVLIGTIKTQLDGAAFGGRAPSSSTIAAETSACLGVAPPGQRGPRAELTAVPALVTYGKRPFEWGRVTEDSRPGS